MAPESSPPPSHAPAVVPAPPPSTSEIARKLSFRSAPPPRPSPRKQRASLPPPVTTDPPQRHPPSGYDSDSSLASSVPPAPDDDDDMPGLGELEDVEEEGEGCESASEDEHGQDELQRGMDGERVVMSGYLWKKQERRKAWKKRWFVLRTNKLAYYKDDKEYSLKRAINLYDIHTVAPVTVKKHNYSFGIVLRERTFFVKAATASETEDWVHAMNTMRRRIAERQEASRQEASRQEASPVHGMSFPPSPYLGAAPSPGTPRAIAPSSPTDNTLTSQFAKIPLPGSDAPAGGISGTRRDLSPYPHAPASSEDEDDAAQTVAPTDPNKVILQAYLMKQSRRRKDVWRKRWFVLTSYGVAYSRSHMEVKAQQSIPLSGILDVLEVLDDEVEDEEDYMSAHGHTHPSHGHGQSPPARQFMRGRLSSMSNVSSDNRRAVPPAGGAVATGAAAGAGTGGGTGAGEEHVFKLITAKRNFLLSAPSEEDEIKWLAAVRALLERQRFVGGAGGAGVGAVGGAGAGGQGEGGRGEVARGSGRMSSVPLITQQPPTPIPDSVSLPHPGAAPAPGIPITSYPVPAQQSSFSQSPRAAPHAAPQAQGSGQGAGPGQGAGQGQGAGPGQGQMNRGRSATYTAKSAVADVVRRFHPEREKEG